MVSLLRLLESIREKPKNVRNQYAIWIAVVCTLVIALIWGLSLKNTFAPEVEQQEVPSAESSFIAELGEIFGALRELPSLFKGTIEYTKETSIEEQKPKNIDLGALVASSTRNSQNQKREGTSTSATTTVRGNFAQ